MLSKWAWDTIVFDDYDYGYKERIEVANVFGAIFVNVFTIPIDILLSPLEIIALILYFIIRRR